MNWISRIFGKHPEDLPENDEDERTEMGKQLDVEVKRHERALQRADAVLAEFHRAERIINPHA